MNYLPGEIPREYVLLFLKLPVTLERLLARENVEAARLEVFDMPLAPLRERLYVLV